MTYPLMPGSALSTIGGMYNSGYEVKNNYSFDQNQQTDSILNYNTNMTGINKSSDTAMNSYNWGGSLMTSAFTGLAGGAIGALAGKGVSGKSGYAAAGAAIGAAAPVLLKSLTNLFG